jgi:hypothetical protein
MSSLTSLSLPAVCKDRPFTFHHDCLEQYWNTVQGLSNAASGPYRPPNTEMMSMVGVARGKAIQEDSRRRSVHRSAISLVDCWALLVMFSDFNGHDDLIKQAWDEIKGRDGHRARNLLTIISHLLRRAKPFKLLQDYIERPWLPISYLQDLPVDCCRDAVFVVELFSRTQHRATHTSRWVQAVDAGAIAGTITGGPLSFRRLADLQACFRVIDMPRDGQCLLHALTRALNDEPAVVSSLRRRMKDELLQWTDEDWRLRIPDVFHSIGPDHQPLTRQQYIDKFLDTPTEHLPSSAVYLWQALEEPTCMVCILVINEQGGTETVEIMRTKAKTRKVVVLIRDWHSDDKPFSGVGHYLVVRSTNDWTEFAPDDDLVRGIEQLEDEAKQAGSKKRRRAQATVVSSQNTTSVIAVTTVTIPSPTSVSAPMRTNSPSLSTTQSSPSATAASTSASLSMTSGSTDASTSTPSASMSATESSPSTTASSTSGSSSTTSVSTDASASSPSASATTKETSSPAPSSPRYVLRSMMARSKALPTYSGDSTPQKRRKDGRGSSPRPNKVSHKTLSAKTLSANEDAEVETAPSPSPAVASPDVVPSFASAVRDGKAEKIERPAASRADQSATTQHQQQVVDQGDNAQQRSPADTKVSQSVSLSDEGKKLATTAADLKADEEKLATRGAELKAGEESLASRAREWKATEETAATRAAELHAGEENLTRRTAEMKAAEETLAARAAQLKAAEEDLATRTAKFNAKEEDLATRTAKFNAEEEDLATRTAKFNAKEDLATWTAELKATQEKLMTRTADLEEPLDARTAEMKAVKESARTTKLKKQLATSTAALEAAKENFAARTADLEQQLATRTAALEAAEEARGTIREQASEISRLNDKVGRIRKERNELRDRVEKYEEEVKRKTQAVKKDIKHKKLDRQQRQPRAGHSSHEQLTVPSSTGAKRRRNEDLGEGSSLTGTHDDGSSPSKVSRVSSPQEDEDRCKVCRKMVRDYTRWLECSECKGYFHVKCVRLPLVGTELTCQEHTNL